MAGSGGASISEGDGRGAANWRAGKDDVRHWIAPVWPLAAAAALVTAGCSESPSNLPGPARAAASSQPPAPVPTAAGEYADVGSVPVGGTTEARFRVRNDSCTPLRIRDVQVECGCLAPTYPPSIGPGEAGEIRVRFSPLASSSGRIEQHLKVHTDDPRRRVIDLTLVAQVTPLITVFPQSQLSLNYYRGDTLHTEVQLVPKPGSDVRFERPTTDSPLARASLKGPVPSEPGKRALLRIDLGPLPGPGDLMIVVKVPTTEKRIPVLPIRVTALAQDTPVVSPAHVAVASMAANEAGKELARLRIFSRGPHLGLGGVETGSPGLRAETLDRVEGHAYTVALSYAGGWKPGVVQTTVRVRTDDSHFPVLSVPFRALVR